MTPEHLAANSSQNKNCLDNPGWKRLPLAIGGFLLVAANLIQPITAQDSEPASRPSPQPATQGNDVFAGPGGPGRRGGAPFMMGGVEEKLLARFDKNADGWLNASERKAARQMIEDERESGKRQIRSGRPPAMGESGQPPDAGKKISPADVKSYDTPFYDPATLRTIFIEFENSDWEKELSDFHNTDVEVPAKVRIDGKTYNEVGIHFRGMSSYMGVREGRKKSLNLSLDLVHDGQNVGGYRTLNLLNAHEDASFLRAILFYEIARNYIPAPKANFARVVINGEDWGVYQNVQQFNKDFVKENFGTTKGARWKVRGSPGGQGSLKYLGDDPEVYKRIYTIKSKDDPKSWAALINLCKVLSTTPADKLEEALKPILDIEGALKFIALDNALINNDGYWIRTSDYSLYLDEKGKFHVIPQDANETFARPMMMGGMRNFNPAMTLVRGFFDEGDKDKNKKLSGSELSDVAETWFAKLDANKSGKIDADQFTTEMGKILPEPSFGGPGGPGGGFRGGPPNNPPGDPNRPDGLRQQGGVGPGGMGRGPRPATAPALFKASDQNQDDSLTSEELKSTFAKWLSDWDENKDEALTEEELQKGLATILPAPNFGGRMAFGPGGPGGPPGGPASEQLTGNPGAPVVVPFNGPDGAPGFPPPRGGGGPQMRGMPGPGNNMPRVEGVKLSPLIAAGDENKPLISKLIAVPSLKARYLGYVRDIAGKHLGWENLGPKAERYHNLIASAVREDTRKLDSTEAFEKSLTEDAQGGGGPRITISLKSFADQRRDYLLNFKEENGTKK